MNKKQYHVIGKELINIPTKMSKSTAPKLNLQIRSASFKESSDNHAGTSIPKRTPSLSQSQLLKAPWKSEDKSTTISKNDRKVIVKKSSENVDDIKVVQRVDKAKIETQSNPVKEALRNDLKLVSKEKQGIINVTKVLKDNDLDSGKRTGGSKPIENNKLIGNEGKLDLPTRGVKQGEVKVKMKTESQNNVTSLMFKPNRSHQVSQTSSVKMNDETKIHIGSLSVEMSQKTETEKDQHDATVNNENQSSSSLKVESSSLKNKEKNETFTNIVNVPYDRSPVKVIQLSQGVTNTNKTNADTDSISEIKDSNNVLVENLNQTAVDMRVDNDNTQVTESKDSISRAISSNELLEVKGNLSKSSSSTKLTLPEKRKVSDDPETVIAELEAYLREKFGSLVDETYEQVGETESEIVSESQSSAVEPEGATVLNFSSETNSDKTSQVSSPVSTPTTATADNKSNAFIPHPIFFKTSIKKDPGSKLHDALVSELSTVLKKRDDPNSDSKESDKNEASKSDSDKSNFPRRRISAKGNKVIGDKALRQHLEDHLTRTLHKNKIFQRQSLKVLGLDTIEIKQENKTEGRSSNPVIVNDFKGAIPPAPVPPPVPNYGAVPLHIVPKATEKDNKSSGKSLEPKVEESEAKSDIKIDDKVFQVSDSNVGDEGSNSSEISGVYNEETGESMSPGSKNDELLVYTYEHPSGRTEGVVCSVKTDNNPDSTGKHRKYITCVNIVAEKSGCPFTQTVEDGGMPTASGGGLYFAEEDKPAVFTVDVGRRKGDLGVHVQGPNSIAKYSIDQQADGSFMVTYIPVEVGLFDINVTWNNNEIAGSPYRPKVVDSRKVRIIGGWQHFMDSNERLQLAVGERKQLPFDISEAGPGTLRAEVSGPSGAIDADIDTYTHGKNVVEFTPQEEGNHYIHIFWSDLPLVNSPFLGYAVPQHVDASKIILTGRGLREAVVREESEFMIDGSQAGQGSPEVTLTGIKAEVGVRIVGVGNGRFKCSYVPVVPGAYLLHINWNGRQLRGSPYKVNVIGAFYPNKVVVSGEGIHGGILGREIDVRIDTRKAGPGELTAYCMGPRQVGVCELADNHDGTFRLGIRPKEAGRHVLQIKYGGEHVQGSPFVFKVTAQPDASKVRVVGPGVEHGILATFVSRFIVETKGAGAGQLTVRIRGPKGGFQVEMYRDSQRDRTILCRYDPTECGLYIISVKWSGVDVPGSPFHVHILDTQEELEQVLNEVSYSIKTGGSHGSFQQSQVNPQRLAYTQWREAI